MALPRGLAADGERYSCHALLVVARPQNVSAYWLTHSQEVAAAMGYLAGELGREVEGSAGMWVHSLNAAGVRRSLAESMQLVGSREIDLDIH